MKLTITQAAERLAAKGISLIGLASYDLQAKTARYYVRLANGDTVVWTSQQVMDAC